MVKMLTVQVEDALLKDIERVISLGSFSSRSEFLKGAIRDSLDKQREKEEWRKNFDELTAKLKKEVYAKGYDGRMPTREERAKIADEWLEERGMRHNKITNRLEKIRK